MSDVLVIACGGTIDKDYPRVTKGYAFEFGDEPGIKRVLRRVVLDTDVRLHVPFQKDSQDMTKEDRAKLLKLCKNAKESRILIVCSLSLSLSLVRVYVYTHTQTHGTDTMIDTAVLLGQEKLKDKSIVLTGSMRPQRFENTDAHFNIGYAMGVLSLVPKGNTMVCMNGMSRPWNRVRRCFETGKFVEGTPRALKN